MTNDKPKDTSDLVRALDAGADLEIVIRLHNPKVEGVWRVLDVRVGKDKRWWMRELSIFTDDVELGVVPTDELVMRHIRKTIGECLESALPVLGSRLRQGGPT